MKYLKNKNKYLLLFVLFLLLILITELYSFGVSNTKHNLSVSGPGTVKATSEQEVCVFCHAPHNTAKTPLWNKPISTATYTLYSSPTKHANIEQPSGNSVLCLSCHDGTIALGTVSNQTSSIGMGSVISLTGTGNLGTDLSNDHPFSFNYDANLASANGQLVSPASLGNTVSLEEGKVQCTSCHDAHSSVNTSFLKVTSQNSMLCTSCHVKTGWTGSSHYSSPKTWNGAGVNPWFHTPLTYSTVQSNGCENCHNPHNAAKPANLLNFSADNDNCMVCHNGNGSTKNLQSDFNKTYRHNVSGISYNGVHSPAENNLVQTQHVECVDCHNPHQSNASPSNAPNVNGYTAGVKGVTAAGTDISPALFEYQICNRCHSSNSWKPLNKTTRQFTTNNVMLEFNTNNASYHPIINNKISTTDMPSLISPWTSSSMMKCTDCHASDGIDSPKGPHGSNYPSILKKQYLTADFTSESELNYALCYDCHSRTSILGDQSFAAHSKHIVDNKTPCNVCHDPHGVNSPSAGNGRLINFNTNIVTAYKGVLAWIPSGTRQGKCQLTCHNYNHAPSNYP